MVIKSGIASVEKQLADDHQQLSTATDLLSDWLSKWSRARTQLPRSTLHDLSTDGRRMPDAGEAQEEKGQEKEKGERRQLELQLLKQRRGISRQAEACVRPLGRSSMQLDFTFISSRVSRPAEDW